MTPRDTALARKSGVGPASPHWHDESEKINQYTPNVAPNTFGTTLAFSSLLSARETQLLYHLSKGNFKLKPKVHLDLAAKRNSLESMERFQTQKNKFQQFTMHDRGTY